MEQQTTTPSVVVVGQGTDKNTSNVGTIAAIAGIGVLGYLAYKNGWFGGSSGDNPPTGDDDDDEDPPVVDSPVDPGSQMHDYVDQILATIGKEDATPAEVGAGVLALHDAAILQAQADCRLAVNRIRNSDMGCLMYDEHMDCPHLPNGQPDNEYYKRLATANGQPMLIDGTSMLEILQRGKDLTWEGFHDYPSGRWNNEYFRRYRTPLRAVLTAIDAKVGRNRPGEPWNDVLNYVVGASQGVINTLGTASTITNDMIIYGAMPAAVFGSDLDVDGGTGSPAFQALNSQLSGWWHGIGWGNTVQNQPCSAGGNKCSGLTLKLMSLYWLLGWAEHEAKASYQNALLQAGRQLHRERYGQCITYNSNTAACQGEINSWLDRCDNISIPMDADALAQFLRDIYPHT